MVKKEDCIYFPFLFRNPNFLILDEPTNDLDLPTLGVLENFLTEFPGCLVIVSHDRYFMDRLVDHLFVFEGDGVIRDFPGNYSQYRESIVDSQRSTERISEKKQSAMDSGPSTVDKRRQLLSKKKENLKYWKKRLLS